MSTTLDKKQRDLLGSFADGPKIWDAADLFKIVCQLEIAGYVKFVKDGPMAEITDAGRAVLDHAPMCTGIHAPGEACSR